MNTGKIFLSASSVMALRWPTKSLVCVWILLSILFDWTISQKLLQIKPDPQMSHEEKQIAGVGFPQVVTCPSPHPTHSVRGTAGMQHISVHL